MVTGNKRFSLSLSLDCCPEFTNVPKIKDRTTTTGNLGGVVGVRAVGAVGGVGGGWGSGCGMGWGFSP